MVRRHYRCFMALDQAEIATTIIALLNVRYGSIGDIRGRVVDVRKVLGMGVERRCFNVCYVPEADMKASLVRILSRRPSRGFGFQLAAR
jgi:hypothetical protein